MWDIFLTLRTILTSISGSFLRTHQNFAELPIMKTFLRTLKLTTFFRWKGFGKQFQAKSFQISFWDKKISDKQDPKIQAWYFYLYIYKLQLIAILSSSDIQEHFDRKFDNPKVLLDLRVCLCRVYPMTQKNLRCRF